MSKKILLTSGCSFTAELKCWPNRIIEHIDIDLLNVGMLSQGNGLISRKVIYNVEKLLKEYSPDDIIVGIMWSGVDRYDYYSHSTEDISDWGYYKKENNVQIPTNITDKNYNWKIINSHWKSDEVKLYYKYYHTNIFAMIQTIEHILRIQWYLDKLNIKYFMTTYMDIFKDEQLINNVEIKYLFDKINFEKFLPVNGCYEWVGNNYANNYSKAFDYNDHPSKFGYSEFTNKIIIPYLKNNNII